jgi:hypothetical protein
MPGQRPKLPAELIVVCILMFATGLVLVIAGIVVLDLAVQAMSSHSLFGLTADIGLLGLDLALVVLALGAGMIVLGVRLLRADRAARGMSYILLGSTAVSTLAGSDHSMGFIIAGIISLACLAILAGSPRVRNYFTGPYALHAGEGVSVTIARTLLIVLACAAILLGIALVPAGDLGPGLAVPGVVLIAVGVGIFVNNTWLARGDQLARIIATSLMLILAIIVLVTIHLNSAGIYPIMFAVGVTVLLWIPPDSQRHFSARPLTLLGAHRPAAAATPGAQYQAPAAQFQAPATQFQAPAAQFQPPATHYQPPGGSSFPAPATPAGATVTQPAGQEVGYCGNCGTRRGAEDKFCMNCGQPL